MCIPLFDVYVATDAKASGATWWIYANAGKVTGVLLNRHVILRPKGGNPVSTSVRNVNCQGFGAIEVTKIPGVAASSLSETKVSLVGDDCERLANFI